MQAQRRAAAAAAVSYRIVPQGTLLATVGHVKKYILPSLIAEYRAFDGAPHEGLSDDLKDRKSHVATAIKNWMVSEPFVHLGGPSRVCGAVLHASMRACTLPYDACMHQRLRACRGIQRARVF